MPRKKKESTLIANLKNGDVFKAIIDFVAKAGGELDLFFDESGMSAVARDARNVAMYDVQFSESSFEKYEVTNGCEFHFLVMPKPLKKAIQVSRLGDSLEIKATGPTTSNVQEPEFFDMFWRNDGFTFQLEVKCKSVDPHYEAVPTIKEQDKYDCEITMPTSHFKRLAQDFAVFPDTDLKIACTRREGVTFSAGHKKTGMGLMKLCESSIETDIRIKCKKEREMFFSLMMVNLFVLPASVCKKVTFRVKEHAPLRVDYDVDDDSYIRFYLAPKQTELDDCEMQEE